MSFYSEKWIKKTRKPHRCIWCGEMIPAGSTTCYSSGTWDGDFYADHLHPECAAARDANLAENGEWESGGDYARGRQDDKRELPPEFAASYRGTSATGERPETRSEDA